MRQKMTHCIYQTRILYERIRGNQSDLDVNFALISADFIDLYHTRGADTSLARPGRKQATATKL